MYGRVGLAQLIRFLVVELIHSDSDLIFNMSVVFMTNYFLVGDGVHIDSELFLVRLHESQDKTVQSFRGDHKDKMCVHVFIVMIICMCIGFIKKYMYDLTPY
jgi:hypothetical protein